MRKNPETDTGAEIPSEKVGLFSYKLVDGRLNMVYLIGSDYPYTGYAIHESNWSKVHFQIPRALSHDSEMHTGTPFALNYEGDWNKITQVISELSEKLKINPDTDLDNLIRNNILPKNRDKIDKTLKGNKSSESEIAMH